MLPPLRGFFNVKLWSKQLENLSRYDKIKIINGVTERLMYDVVAENVAGTGIKVIATKNIELLAKK